MVEENTESLTKRYAVEREKICECEIPQLKFNGGDPLCLKCGLYDDKVGRFVLRVHKIVREMI